MSGILFLGNDDFCVRAGEKGNMLCMTGWKGLTLVMFYSTECKYCGSLISKFKQLPTIVNGCKFGMVCVNRNMEVVEKSKNTISPIEYVPDVILFVDGIPYIRYDGAHDIDNIKTFIFTVYERLQKTCFSENNNNNSAQSTPPPMAVPSMASRAPQLPPPPTNYQMTSNANVQTNNMFTHDDIRRMQQQHTVRQSKNAIPEYTIGMPVIGKKEDQARCYLEFKTAYPGNNRSVEV